MTLSDLRTNICMVRAPRTKVPMSIGTGFNRCRGDKSSICYLNMYHGTCNMGTMVHTQHNLFTGNSEFDLLISRTLKAPRNTYVRAALIFTARALGYTDNQNSKHNKRKILLVPGGFISRVTLKLYPRSEISGRR